ncbi:hypothetical protein [Rhizobium halophilum]|uniref:hypothetical protein n=1 Tax=Rhizobium halophilum TaxID=2846852 RepID=UPI001EFC768A|nr:hypothetical protein [Rhizobium halophilum]MCF6371231.1 hypothetical protein [Rhizobium halophilum]
MYCYLLAASTFLNAGFVCLAALNWLINLILTIAALAALSGFVRHMARLFEWLKLKAGSTSKGNVRPAIVFPQL